MPSSQKFGQGDLGQISTANISNLNNEIFNKIESKVIAPRNPKLIKTTELPKTRMTPSTYMHLMSLDTEEKLAKTRDMRLPQIIELLDMSETTHQKISYVDIEQAMFQPFPSEIYFQSFEPFRTYEVPLLLRNNDKVPRLVKVIQEDSPYFKIISPDDVSHKVAPGMASVFRIQFTPEDKKDYRHELICMTEREKFIVPVIAIGSRAILDFPDEVHFGMCPVKHPETKVLFVRNVGNRESKCTFSVDKPFKVLVESSVLPVGGSTQVTLEFKADKIGDHQSDLLLKYDTGEEVCVALYGAAVDANVRLDKSTLRIDNTYIFMANQRTVTIHNRSDVLVHFKWSPYATKIEEDSQKERFCSELDDEESQEKERFLNECIQDPTLRDRLSILTRTFKNRKSMVSDDPLLFTDDIFKVYPLEGDIWPNSTVDVTVVFKPIEAKSYQQIVFCDITGRESRLPLKVRGDGMGPKLGFSFDSIDIGSVFTSSVHNYEVVMINKGDIDAIFNLVPDNSPDTRFYDFRFDPVEGIVLPGGHQAMEITFRSETIGKFSQEFRFAVDGSPDDLNLTVKGNVIGPTFHFDVPRLRFGNASFGFNHTKICSLVNTSLVPMTFFIRIPEDGSGEPSISSLSDLGDSLLAEMGGMKKIQNPHEFDITPAQGTIAPQDEIKIHVTLCSNTLKKYDCNMVVDVKGVGKDIFSIPIAAKCIVPNIQIMTPVIDFKRCFLNFPYQGKVQLSNETDLMAKYELLPQVRDELSHIVYGSAMPKGLIEPRCSVEVPILIQVTELEEQEVTGYFSIFGLEDQPLPFQIQCIGEGPVVHVTPNYLNWSQIEVLTPSSKVVSLSNESLIPADFVAQMMRPDSVWSLEPSRGTIPPEGMVEILVTAFLDDSIKFQDKLTVSVVKGPIFTLPVSGRGYGTTIVVEPPISPAVNLGPHFAKTKCIRKFKLTNSGRRHQALTWSNEGFMKRSTKGSTHSIPQDPKVKSKTKPPALTHPVFQLHPARISLDPKQTAILTLEGYSAKPHQVSESLACHAIIGKDRGKEKIIKACVRADFISPVLELSTKRIDFRVDKEPNDVTALIPQTKTFTMRNVSSLPLSCLLQIQYPFQLLGFYGSPQSVLEVNLALSQELEITIRFDPAFKEDLTSRVAEGEVTIKYQEHPQVDTVQLRGEVNFPNLEFDKQEIDFGFILNDTEVARFLDITNTSPLPVVYRWSFLVTEGEQHIRYIGEVIKPDSERELENESDLPPNPETDPEKTEKKPAVPESDIHIEVVEPEKEVTSQNPDDAPSVAFQNHVGHGSGELPEISEENEESEDRAPVVESEVKPTFALELLADEPDVNLPLNLDFSKQETPRDEEAEEKALQEEHYRPISRLSSRHQPTHPIHTHLNELPLLPWLNVGTNHIPNGVEEIFDILPLYGSLEPGETQRVTFTYYGHADVSCSAKAICDIQGGPKYEVKLQGEASLIEYRFNKAVVNYGKQMFDQTTVGEVVLENCGRVGFNFVGISGLGEDPSIPGIPILEPMSGFVPAFSKVTLLVHYLPGVPEKFHKTFEIQIAHFEPTIINVMGEGIFPRLSLDLPRFTDDDERYVALVKEARENLEHETNKHEQSLVSTPQKRKDECDSSFQAVEHVVSDLDIQMEVERIIMRDLASENQHIFAGTPIVQLEKSAVNKLKKKRKFPRVRLSDYLLDFGHVILGNVRSHIVRATNTSHFPISFSADRSGLHHSGFNVELNRVKQLPGHPDHETVDFKVTFDPRGANLGVGQVEAFMPINIVSGPQICLRLRAYVAVPDLVVSSDSIDFEMVQCGQCKVVTVQLYNEQMVKCEWSAVNSESLPSMDEKHMPMHLRKKMRKQNKPKPLHFEMMPTQGYLAPGQRMNVQIKFMPTESRYYTQRLTIRIAQSMSRVAIGVRGEGQEPRLDFDPNLVEFGPILPHGVGDEVDVTVRNPTPFAVEFYSLDFDKQYLIEEKILRMMRGYDEVGNLLLPPRLAGEELPPELLQFYQEQEEKMLAARAKAKAEAQEIKRKDGSLEDAFEEHEYTVDEYEENLEDDFGPEMPPEPNDGISRNSSKRKLDSKEQGAAVNDSDNVIGVGDLEITPVSAAIARHLGIDLTPEGRAARNRRGIVVLVHGPPGSGKTNTSVLLAKTYGAARLTVDGIVMEAISNGNTLGGLKARELCANAARGFKDDDGEGGAGNQGGLSVEAVTAHTGPSVETKGGSIVSTKKTSLLSKPQHSVIGSKVGANTQAMSEHTGSHVPSSPLPADGPVCRRLSVSASVAGEQGLVSCVLPEDLLVEILAERLQLNDCHQGVIFDSLETLFSTNFQSTLLAVLKAVNNRKHIYFVSQKLDYALVKQRQNEKEAEKAKALEDEAEKKKLKLEELDEDDYEALTDEQRKDLEEKIIEKRREQAKKRREERQEKERLEREKQQLLEEKRLEEENLRKKGKKPKREETAKRSVSGKQDSNLAPPNKEKGNVKGNVSNSQVAQGSSHDAVEKNRPDSRITDRSDEEHTTKKGKKKHRPVSDEDQKDKIVEEPVEELSEEEQLLQQKFKNFDKSFRDICYVLEHWDRSQLIVVKPTTPENGVTPGLDDDAATVITGKEKGPASGRKGTKKEKERERLERLERERIERERLERERIEREKALEEAGGEKAEEQGISHLQMDANNPDQPCYMSILSLGQLPVVEEILDGLGLGPQGPPIPPPALFSVVPYPVKRKAPSGDPSQHYEFIAASSDDPNAASESQAPKDGDSQMDDSSPVDLTRTDSKKEESVSPFKEGRRKKDHRSETAKTGRRSSPRRSRRGSSEGLKSPPPPVTPASEADQASVMGDSLQEMKNLKLTHFRWVVPAYSEVAMKIQFTSDDLGQFDQTLNFEITGTRRRYQLFCRGICAFPTISREPRVVFPHRRKAKVTSEDIIMKKYLIQEEFFEFGPLLCGKTRERYKDGRYPENMEKISIMNTSPLTGYISFCFQHDSNASTFLLDPPNMILEPNESKQLSIWAYPKTAGRFMDTLVCCVRENPEPICFNVACYGVRPEIELDKKLLQFEKVLLHRKDFRTLYLRNSTMLPVAWHVAGMENMGDDFSLNQDSGIIEPKCEFALQLNFRATKAANIKKAIRLEVSDVSNIMGLVQTENIGVTAEAYDVALDMSFPKGADGGLDFGSLRVQDETKQTCSLKNKGKYEIGFNFVFERNAPNCPPIEGLFSVLPQKGTLIPNDRPTQVQVIFRSNVEVSIRDLPLLKCQVIEPSIGDGKEVIASIPIRLSVRSVFSKYTVFPSTDINFGPMILNTKKSRTFTIENKGEFDFKYTVMKMIRDAPNVRPRPMVLGGRRAKSRDGSSSSRSAARIGRAASLRQDVASNQTRISAGSFTIYPGFGTILPGGVQNITVDCIAENMEKSEEFLSIDITDRDPNDNASGIPYRLLAEGCLPSINIVDHSYIFEEHRVCKNLNVHLQNNKTLEATGIYGEEDNRFMFCNVIVGKKATAKFKILNTNKIPVDVTFAVKPISNKVSARIHDIFDVEVSKKQIPPHSHTYACVTFSPPAMHTYMCHFEATVDGLPPTIARNRSLYFEISGDGNLPRVSVTEPTVRNTIGDPLLMYQRLLINRSETLSLILKNEGTFPSKVNIVLEHQIETSNEGDTAYVEPQYSDQVDEKVFTLVPSPDTQANVPLTLPTSNSIPYIASVILSPDESSSFHVTFQPTGSRVYRGRIKLSVVDNQFEEHKIQLYGEGFQDDVTFDKLHLDGDMAHFASDDGVLDTDAVSQCFISDPSQGGSGNISETLSFGDCEVGVPSSRKFSICNHSTTDPIRFRFEDHANVKFVPTIGHILPDSSKEITASFKCDEVADINKSLAKCSVSKITYPVPLDSVADWDDRMRTVKWADAMDPNTACARPAKKKVVETEAEPEHTVVEESNRQLELNISAVVDYTQCVCGTTKIGFKDTLMFQSRVYDFDLKNAGKVMMRYNWKTVMEGLTSHSISDLERRPSTSRSIRSVGVESSIRSMVEESFGFPFSISPCEGKIKAGEKETFTVRYLPTDVSEHNARLICSVPNLVEEEQGPVIQIKGRSLMPFCHFELQESDYISSSKRNPEQPGPAGAPPGTMLDPNTRVIEFNSIGVDNRNNIKFWIMNPTGNTYTFQWICQDIPDARVPSKFTCHVPGDELVSGKKLEMHFSFLPTNLDVCESFWKFVILEQNISIPFLLVGQTKEPQVMLSATHVNFKSMLLGHIASDTVELINEEKTGFNFQISESSCHTESYSSSVIVSPPQGFIPGNSRVPLKVSYKARKVGDVNFNVIIQVSRKTKKLSLNVKANVHSIDAQLLCENSQGDKVELSSAGLNAINLGKVEVRGKSIRHLFVVNNGKHNFNFVWTLRQYGLVIAGGQHESNPVEETREDSNTALSNKRAVVSISPENGSVQSGTRKRCVLTFQPKKLGSIPVAELSLQVRDGPTYLCHVTGAGVNPGLEFSFEHINFGACFIYRAGMPTNSKVLTIRNKELKEISVECLTSSSNHLDVNFDAIILPPYGTATATFTFYPRETIPYHDVVTFLVNGLSKRDVEVKGEGTEMRVEVYNPKQKLIRFGALRVGQAVKHVVPITNRSPTPITLTLSVTPVSQYLQDSNILKVLPSEPITLDGKGGTQPVEVYFTPRSRIPAFTEEIMMECAGMSQPLFIVSGSCQGIQITLDQESIPFGAVVQGSKNTRRFVMQNGGDIGAGFRWDAAAFSPDFSISPVAGYISPGMEVPFTISFHPRDLSPDIRYDNLKCAIEGGKTLSLTLTGMCIGTPAIKEVVSFSCHVRGKDVRNIVVTNRSNQIWQLKPVVEGEFWSGPDTFIVEAQHTRQYELVYRPLTMTTDGKKHQGSVFFPLPDGGGMLYNLVGQSDPPKPVSSVSREVPCKTAYVELLPVVNWLRKSQRFKVTVEMIKPDKLDAGTTLKGLDYIDVPGSAKRDYKLNFFAHKEGTFGAKIVFKNEKTSEYLFYYITLRATSPGIMSIIELETPVRRSALHTIKVENPLPYPVSFQTECKIQDINLPPQFTVPPSSEGTCMFEYQPLKVGENTGKLVLVNNDLGMYSYDLQLRATPAGPEKTTFFKTNLGSHQVMTIKFQNYARQKTDYSCKIDSNEWNCERSITAAPASSGSGTEVTIDITYEPISLGASRAILSVTSSIGGDYLFPLQGTCDPPKPQGPFVIRNKSNVSIPFRNVFPTPQLFNFQVDNPVFSVKQSDTIRSKKTNNITVSYDSHSPPGSVVTGKLTLTCSRGSNNYSWVFYLKGSTPEQHLL